jgi:hypothetical protein
MAVPIYISLIIIYISRHLNKMPKERKAIVIESFDEDKKMIDQS